MASLIKIGQYWHVQWNDAGRIRRISTKIKHDEKEEASPVCLEILEKHKQLEVENKHGLLRDILVKEVLDAYIKDIKNRTKKKEISQRTYENIINRLPYLVMVCEESGIKYLGDLNETNIGLVVTRLKTKYKNNTIRHLLSLLSTLWNFGKAMRGKNHFQIANIWGSSFFNPPAERRSYPWGKEKIKRLYEITRKDKSTVAFLLFLQAIYGMRISQAFNTYEEFRLENFQKYFGNLKPGLRLPLKFPYRFIDSSEKNNLNEGEVCNTKRLPENQTYGNSNKLSSAQSQWLKTINKSNNNNLVGINADSLSHILPYIFAHTK